MVVRRKGLKKRLSGGTRNEVARSTVARRSANLSRKEVLQRSSIRRRTRDATKLAKQILQQRKVKEVAKKTQNKKTHRTLSRDEQALVMDGIAAAIQAVGGAAVSPVTVFAAATTAILKESSSSTTTTVKQRLPYLLNAILSVKRGLSANVVVQKLDVIRQVAHKVIIEAGATDYVSLTKAYKLVAEYAELSVTAPVLDALRKAGSDPTATTTLLHHLPALIGQGFDAIRHCDPGKFHADATPLFAEAIRKYMVHLFALDERQKQLFGVTASISDDEWEDMPQDEDDDDAVQQQPTPQQALGASKETSSEVLWAVRSELLKLFPQAVSLILHGFASFSSSAAQRVADSLSRMAATILSTCVSEFAGFVFRKGGSVEEAQVEMLRSVFDPFVSTIVDVFRVDSGMRSQWTTALRIVTTVFSQPTLTIFKRCSCVEEALKLAQAVPHPAPLPLMKVDDAFAARVAADDALFRETMAQKLPSLFTVVPSCRLLLRVLDKLRCMDDAELHTPLEDAMVAIGNCLSFRDMYETLPFDPHSDGADPQRCWERSYLVNTVWRRVAHHDSLRFFADEFLPRIRHSSETARVKQEQGLFQEAHQFATLRDQYWRICAAFAQYPVDFDEIAFRNIARAIVAVLDEGPTTPAAHSGCLAIQNICSTLSGLALESPLDDDLGAADDGEGLESRYGDALAIHDDVALHPHRHHFISWANALRACNLISKYSKNIMPKLCNAAEGIENAAGAPVMAAVASFAKVCQPQVMASILKGIADVASNVAAGVHTTKQGLSAQRRMVLDIAVGIVPQLDSSVVEMLFHDVVKPALQMQDASGSASVVPIALQKKAYRLLGQMLEHRSKDITSLLVEVIGSLRAGAETVQPPAIKNRLHCLIWALHACKMYDPEQILTFGLEFLDEVVLCVRERSHEARLLAMEWIEHFYRYAATVATDGHVTSGGALIIHRVLAGLAGRSPLSLSATILCLGKLLWCSYADIPISDRDLTRLCLMIFRLADHAAAEIRNSAVVFARTSVKLGTRAPRLARCLARGIEPSDTQSVDIEVSSPIATLLNSIAVTVSQAHVASATRRQMQQLTERLLDRYGLPALERLFPVGSRKFLQHVARNQRRSERRAARQSEQQEEQALIAELTADDQTSLLLKEPGIDLLDEGGLAQVVAQDSSHRHMRRRGNNSDDESEDDYHLDILPEGKLRIITKTQQIAENEEASRKATAARLLEQASRLGRLRGSKSALQGPTIAAAEVNDEGKRKRTADTEDFENEELFRVHGSLAPSSRADGAQPGTQRRSSNRASSADGQRSAKRLRFESDIKKGDEYRGSGLGDVKKGNVDPYAYVPLNRAMLNKRNQSQRVHRFKVVTHRGLRGAKAQRAVSSNPVT